MQSAERCGGLRLSANVMTMLRCVDCRGPLSEGQEALACPACGRSYPLIRGIVRFVDAQKYAGTFGFQWQRYTHTQLDNECTRESENTFRRKTGFMPEELRGKLVLDVGCGMGRFADVANRWGARVLGVDLSEAAAVAARNLADRDSACFFQADLFSLPFSPGSFDYIYSIGVLHHTPDCEKAFKSLVPYLKPGGRIAIWLYSGYNKWYRFSDIYREVTTRMPARWLHGLCHIAVPLYYVHRALRAIPLVGRPASGLLAHLLPVSENPDREWRVLDTFDWYSPRYQSKHTYEQVFRWFEECGLEAIRVLHEPVAVQGCKPAGGMSIQVEQLSCAASQAS